MKNDGKNKAIYFTLIITSIIALIPLFLLSYYNNPTLDDYTYALRDSSKNAIETAIYTYLNWSGRYFSTAIAQFNPLAYHSFLGYKIYPILILLIFSGAFFYLFHSLFHNVLSKLQTASLSMFFILLYLFQAPSICESFYWFSGSAAFTIPSILTIILVALLIQKRNYFKQSIAILLTICICGGNEVSAIIILSIIGFINYLKYKEEKKINKQNLVLLIASIICIIIIVASPGNSIRIEGETTSRNYIWTIGGSLFQSLSWFVIWGQSLLLASIVYTAFFGLKIAESINIKVQKIFNVKHKFFLPFFLVTLYLSHIPPLWGLGTVAIGRIANVIYIFFIFSWFYYLQLIINKYKSQIAIKNNPFCICLCYISFIVFLTNNVFNLNNNIATSYVDLITGKAEKYNDALEKRYFIVNNNRSNEKLIVFDALNNCPKTIFFRDFDSDEKYWANKSFKQYWNCKPSIRIKEQESSNYSNFESLKAFGKEIRKNKFSR